MKSINTILLILVFPFIIQAQNLVEENKEWSFADVNVFGGLSVSTHTVKLENDTLINGVTYKQIWESNDSLANDWQVDQYNFIREDSLNRVYLYNNGTEKLIYDFSVEIGDTMFLDFDKELILIDTDSIELNNSELRKRYTFKGRGYGQDCPDNIVWIKGIGGLWGLLTDPFTVVCSFDYPYRLLCYSENGETLYQNTNFESCYVDIVSAKEVDKTTNIQIYPNPLSDFMNIEFSENKSHQNYSIRIFDLNGTERIFKKGNQLRESIHIDGLESGIYLVMIYQDDLPIYYKKIIKHL